MGDGARECVGMYGVVVAGADQGIVWVRVV